MKRMALVVAGFLAGAVIALQIPSVAQDTGGDGPTERTITVNGTAKISADPDEAIVTLGVRTQAERAQEAMDQNSAKMKQVIDALHALGFGDDDLATSMIELYPRYDDRGETITGYDASNQIEVTIHDLSKVGRVLDTGVDNGANVAGGIRFRVSDENAGLDEALASAVEDAKAKAQTMAGAADANVGEVVTIVENGGGGGPQPYYAERVMYAAADAAVPVEAPTIETEVSVTVTWSLV
jgi:uncharacterized protein YggE